MALFVKKCNARLFWQVLECIILIYNVTRHTSFVVLYWKLLQNLRMKRNTQKRLKGLLRRSSFLQLVPIWKLQAGAVLKCRLQGGQLPSCLWLYQCWHLTLAAVLELNPPLKKRREGSRISTSPLDISNKGIVWMISGKRKRKVKYALHGGRSDGRTKSMKWMPLYMPCLIPWTSTFEFCFTVCPQTCDKLMRSEYKEVKLRHTSFHK